LTFSRLEVASTWGEALTLFSTVPLIPTVARRVVKTRVKLSLPDRADGTYPLVLKPVEPAIVFEKIVVDYGGYEDSYLFMDESPCRRNKLNGQ
jgi:hypothetical protein